MKIWLFLTIFFSVPQLESTTVQYLAPPPSPAQMATARAWKNRAYLATYPRSGNHWMRYLIEEATGIATSSIYRDFNHLSTIFPWGGYCPNHGYEGKCIYPVNGAIVVVKTHFPIIPSIFEDLPYFQAIRIIRHPIDSFYSWYLFQQKSRDKPFDFWIPRDRLLQYIKLWRKFQEHWDSAPNVLTFRYEDLYQNPTLYLNIALETIGYETTPRDIERAVAKYPPTGGILKHSIHFTDEDLSLIHSSLSDLMEKYGYTITEVR